MKETPKPDADKVSGGIDSPGGCIPESDPLTWPDSTGPTTVPDLRDPNPIPG